MMLHIMELLIGVQYQPNKYLRMGKVQLLFTECLSECLAQNSSNWVQLENEAQAFLSTLETVEFHSLI